VYSPHSNMIVMCCISAFSLLIFPFIPPNVQPLHCTLVKLDGMYLTRPKVSHQNSLKHCFTLHAPEQSNHRKWVVTQVFIV
jgi:hypothetical protein